MRILLGSFASPFRRCKSHALLRTERDARSIGIGANALASSIVLVCRKRAADAATISRREFLRELNAVLPEALDEMTRGGVNSPVAPVDLSQAIIGPGMAVFSQYAAVVDEIAGTTWELDELLRRLHSLPGGQIAKQFAQDLRDIQLAEQLACVLLINDEGRGHAVLQINYFVYYGLFVLAGNIAA